MSGTSNSWRAALLDSARSEHSNLASQSFPSNPSSSHSFPALASSQSMMPSISQESEPYDSDSDDLDDRMHQSLPHDALSFKASSHHSLNQSTNQSNQYEEFDFSQGVDGGYQRPAESKVRRFLSSVIRKAPYYIPILSWLPVYKRSNLVGDIIAGITVGTILVPQGLIYASLANLPPINGLYACFFPVLIYVCFGSSHHLSIGPEVTTSILIGKTIIAAARLPADASVDDPEIQQKYLVPIAMCLSLLIGLFSFMLGFFRLGFLDSILSRPILAGFLNAVALTLISEQLPTLIGLPPHSSDSPIQSLSYLLSNIEKIHLLTVLISLFCCIAMFSMNAMKKKNQSVRFLVCFPDVLLIVVLMTSLSFGFNFRKMGVATLNIEDTGFRAPEIPRLNDFGNSFLVTSALTITLLGFVESQLVSKKIASKHNYSISANRELVALGLSSIVGSMFGAYSAFGSITRTKIGEAAGSTSNISNLTAAMVSLLSILVLLPLFSWTPKAVTASIIFVVACGIVEIHACVFILQVRGYKDFALSLCMTAITFIFGVDTGIFFAFAVCLLFAVRRTTLPGVALLGRGSNDSDFGAISAIERGARDIEGCLVYSLNGPLYFANAEKLKDSTRRMERFGGFHVHPSEPPKPLKIHSIIFDLKQLTSVDVSALEILHEILTQYRAEKRRVCLVEMPKKVLSKFQLAGLLELVGYENLFTNLEQALIAVKEEVHSNQHFIDLSVTSNEQNIEQSISQSINHNQSNNQANDSVQLYDPPTMQSSNMQDT